jgi:hypothetical protein
MSIHAMEQVLAQSSAPNNLKLNDVPPEVWAAPRSAVPVRGSSLNDSISRSSSFAEARESIQSGASSPMDNLPTNIVNTPLFLAGSSSEGQLSTSYHPQSIEAVDNLLHVIGDHNHPISVYSSTDSAAGHQAAITSHLQHAPASLDVQGDRLTPVYQVGLDTYNASLSIRSMVQSDIRGNPISIITGENN